MRPRLLEIYLNDHLAVVRATGALARRALGENRGTPLGDDLARLIEETLEEREVLVRVLGDLGLRRDRLKEAAALVGERLGRLKLNGSLTGYSDLSRVLELEGLCAAVELKRRLWETLGILGDGRIDVDRMWRLRERSTHQQEMLESRRREAALQAFDGA